jgi:hypothetical protein
VTSDQKSICFSRLAWWLRTFGRVSCLLRPQHTIIRFQFAANKFDWEPHLVRSGQVGSGPVWFQSISQSGAGERLWSARLRARREYPSEPVAASIAFHRLLSSGVADVVADVLTPAKQLAVPGSPKQRRKESEKEPDRGNPKGFASLHTFCIARVRGANT